MRETVTRFLVVMLLSLPAACGEARGPAPRATIDTLESGIVHVSNPQVGVWGERPAWRLTDEVRIGTSLGTGPAMFGDVRDVALDAAGRVYVLDSQAQEIRVFDTAGSYVRTAGRPGAGPGEFRGAAGMLIDPSGNLWVLNQVNQRYTVFDPSGALLAEYPRRGNVAWVAWYFGAFSPEGVLYDRMPVRLPGPDGVMPYGRYDPARGEFLDTVSGP